MHCACNQSILHWVHQGLIMDEVRLCQALSDMQSLPTQPTHASLRFTWTLGNCTLTHATIYLKLVVEHWTGQFLVLWAAVRE
jgi:hypothetical protein